MSPGILVTPQDAVSPAKATTLLNDALTTAPHSFLQPTPELHAASLELAKRYLDPLATHVSETQTARLQEARRKRKRYEREDFLLRDVLRLKQLYVEGFTIDQVWEQARRVIESGRREAEKSVKLGRDAETVPKPKKQVRFSHDGAIESQDEKDDDEEDGEDDDMSGMDDYLDDSEDGGRPEDDDLELENDTGDLEDGIEETEDIDYDSDASGNLDEPATEVFVKDVHGLNDGFFSIDEFNRETEFLERQDARGDPDDGAASDEEDIDWTMNPLLAPLPNVSKLDAEDEDNEEFSEDEDGPVFEDADLNAPFDSSDDDDDLDTGMPLDENLYENTNDIYYKDFFEPPAQPPSKNSKRPLPKTQPPPALEPEDIEADMERTMSAARRDIFEDDDSEEAEEATNQNVSSHERRQAALAAQIRKLEAEAVAKREWAMSGEARANDRPLNSLLEEDLEFERTGKPVPVVTAEVTSSIEELIKQRIIARQFDEVTKRLPGSSLVSQQNARRGLADIDQKRGPNESLAAIYEEEHLKRTDPNYVDPRDTKLKAAHAEIERLWADVSSKLDALSNWNYRPKPPTVEVAVVTDAPRITMEDARPSGVGIAAEESGLAPQEVYKAGEARKSGEVTTKGGTIMNKDELTREEKQRHFRREKERAKKRAGEQAVKSNERNKEKASKDSDAKSKRHNNNASSRKTLSQDLQRGGVKVIGKGGEILDVEGKKVRGKTANNSGGSYKL